MKTINRILFFSGLAMLVFVGNSCEFDDIDPNDYRFSCFIDGKFFVPEDGRHGEPDFSNLLNTKPSGSTEGLTISKQRGYIRVKARNSSGDYVFFWIVDYEIGENLLEKSYGRGQGSDAFNYATAKQNIKRYLSKKNSGSVTFTDLSASPTGTFEFTLYNENDESDIIKVTRGRF